MRETDYYKLFEAFRIIQFKLGWQLKDETSCCGITIAQHKLLMEIGESDDYSIILLSQKTGLDTSTLSRTVNTMVKNSLIKRDQSTKDRRYVTLSLNDKGKKLFRDMTTFYNTYFERVIKKIPINKREQIIESIILLSDAVKDEDSLSCCNSDSVN